MWWLDPGKEILNALFNRILAPYIENLDMNQVNYGVGTGRLSLKKLRLKRGALDKFRLPIDVIDGHLGNFTLSLHWMNLGNQPVEILIEDVFLLVVPSTETPYDPEDEEQRAQAAKLERLESAELLHLQTPDAANTSDSAQSQGLIATLIAKVVNNLQITVKNIHIRYEDKLSVPGHPFAAGFTLAGFTAVSVDELWNPVFVESTAGAIHKLAKLQSLAVYFDTDAATMAGLPHEEFVQQFTEMIAQSADDSSHQFILKPVSGEGRIILNHKIDKDHPRFDVQLLFDEIGVTLDDDQYRDAISLVDMYHVYLRQHQYRKFRSIDEVSINTAQSRLKFASSAILAGVRERRKQWTWEHFAERRDDRNKYVELFQRKILKTIAPSGVKELETLERKLSYDDIRFYRSIARSRLRKDADLRKRLEAERNKQPPAKQGWGSWLWGSGATSQTTDDTAFGGGMTEQQRKELYDALDYDEKASIVETLHAPRNAMKARIAAKLNKGSFSLRADPHGTSKDIISVEFTSLRADVIQRTDNLEAVISLGNFSVFDGTTPNSLHPQIVQVKRLPLDPASSPLTNAETDDPFLFVKFEHKPLDERADNALSLRLRHMEIVYHKGYIEAVYKFLRPPSSQLESVEALLSAASQTLEGISKETRAGLEFALQNHKTIDIQMDLNAPVIIIPENVVSHSCNHLLIDAGHIAIESELVDKEALRSIQSKRAQKYNQEDYRRLESMMYDKFSLKLESAQFVIGDNLDKCREALTSKDADTLHLLDRINLDLQVQNSIVPSALSLAKIKVSGKLPSLSVNISDNKYKALMRVIDVSIPHLGEDVQTPVPPPVPQRNSGVFPLPPLGIFGPDRAAYNIDDDESEDESGSVDDQYFEADEGGIAYPELHQHIFELNFQVDELKASLSRGATDGQESLLGDLILGQFGLSFALAKYDMQVNVRLQSLTMDLLQSGKQRMNFISSVESTSSNVKDLLSVAYIRAQKESPEFSTLFEGVSQSVDIKISTFLFQIAPEPILALYDFIMSTFVPQANPPDTNVGDVSVVSKDTVQGDVNDKIKVSVNLASVKFSLFNAGSKLATLILSTADVALTIRPKALRVSGRLGNLTLLNDNATYNIRREFQEILSIEGENFAEFRYQTFDPTDRAFNGLKSSVYLNTASIKVQFLEQPLHDLYAFLLKLAKLKGIYDAASQAAVQSAPEIERMQFEVSIKSPIIVFPSDNSNTGETLVLRLGEVTARNSFKPWENVISASLTGIQLVSNLGDHLSMLKIIDDIDISADVIQRIEIDRSNDTTIPDAQVEVNISDIRLHLTQIQYGVLIRLSESIPRVFANVPPHLLESDVGETRTSHTTLDVSEPQDDSGVLNLQPELQPTESTAILFWTTVDLVVVVKSIKLHLYDEFATSEDNLRQHGIARASLNSSSLRLKMVSDGSLEAQIVLKSFTISNTRAGDTRFREIIPAAQHDRNQFMILYTQSAAQNSALAVVTIDSPQIIFAVDLAFALLHFFTSVVSQGSPDPDVEDVVSSQSTELGARTIEFRVDLHDVSVNVLDDDTKPDTQSIKLSIGQVLVSQQGILALTVNKLGMSLLRMGSSESVKFLDDVDLTFSLDSRSSSSQSLTSIEMTSKPIIFRASYRDIDLISTIVNKALVLSGQSSTTPEASDGKSEARAQRGGSSSRPQKPSIRASQPTGSGRARVVTSKEQLKASFDGFRLVLIGDLYEQPMIHLKVKRFIVGARDWSGELNATTTMATSINYWNLTNSHWEPLIDPWTFTIGVARANPSSGVEVKFSSQERLDINLSSTFAELALNSSKVWGKEGIQALQNVRGSYAPYRIRNSTGTSLLIWSDVDGSGSLADHNGITIPNEQSVDWRFDDWKTLREHVSASGQHSIGIQLVGKPWEQLRNIPVDQEGIFVVSLRPRTETHVHRLLCEVKVVDNVKLVTLRSAYKVQNLTLYPLEVTLVDDHGQPVYSLEKIAPGQDYCVPIEAVARDRIRIQPDQGFGYRWSSAIRWEDLVPRKAFTVKCPHSDPKEAAFRFQAWVQIDSTDSRNKPSVPPLILKLRAPLELENLLPYNLQYRVYNKNTDQNWRSYLRQGGVMPVHSIELAHLVLLNIEVEDTGFTPSDFAIINTDGNADFDIENRLSIRGESDKKLDLKLNYIRYPESGGAFRVQIYTPYLVINQTGLTFSIRTPRASRSGVYDIHGEGDPMLSHPNDGHEFVLKVGNSAWSKVFSTETPSADTVLIIPSQTQKADETLVGLSWSEGLGKYKLTKVITLSPRFIFKNNLDIPLSIREHGVAPREGSTIQPGDRLPFLVMRAEHERLIKFAAPGLNAQWSAPVNIEDIGAVFVRLTVPGSDSTGTMLVRAEVRIGGPTIFVSLSDAEDEWPFLVENFSDHTIKLSQKNSNREEQPALYTITPRSALPYTWDYPAAKEKKVVLTIQSSQRIVDVMEIGNLVPFKFSDGQRHRAVSLDVRAEGQKQVLRITNYNPENSLYKPKARNNAGTISRQDTFSSSAEAFEAITEEIEPTFALNVNLNGIGISLVNKKLAEVVYISLGGLLFEYTNSSVAQSVNISFGSLQVDNQLHDAIFPVILQPSPIPKDSNHTAALPTVQASIIWLKDEEHGVLFVKYCSVLLQALTIEADEDLLFSLYELIQIQGASWEEGVEDVLIQNQTIPEPSEVSSGQDLYFEVLELQPIKLSISFMRTERVSSDEKLSIHNPLAVVLNALTMAVGNVNDAPLELNALAIKDMRLTLPELQSRITYHYRQDVIRQVYRILFAADFIGNPVGLFTNVSSGVADIFYEPFNGVVMHGNKELGIGIAKGAASFVKKTVFGVSDSVTKFTSSVGKGLSAATFDSEYQARRRMTQRRNKPRHAIYGFASGGEALATSMASAMEGVLIKPIEGAESEGAFGFFKGVGKGLVGAVTKPVVGVLDLASNVSEGIRNTTTVFDNPARDRVRLPRPRPSDGVLKSYSEREATGQYWMRDINNGAYRRESYVAHINSPGSDNVVLLTATRVLCFWSKRLKLEWELLLTQIQGVTVEDAGIRFAHKAGKEHDKFIYIPDKAAQSWFFERISSVVKAFNVQRRLQSV